MQFYFNNKAHNRIPWLDLQSKWEISRLKYVSDLQTGNSIPHKEKDNYIDSFDSIPYISTKDIDTERIDYQNGLYIKNNDTSFKRANKEDTLMCIEGGSAGRKIALLNKEVGFVNKLCSFSPKRIEHRFQYYYLSSHSFKFEFKTNMTGLIGGVSISTLKNHRVPLPPYETQKRIADFLDNETARIDKMITLHQDGIEKLKAAMESLIETTMSNGIRKSDINFRSYSYFYSNVPTDWEYLRLKSIINIIDKRNKDLDARLLSIYTNIGVKPRSELEERGNKNSTVLNYKIVSKNDFIVNKLLAWMGAIGISNFDGVTSPDYDIYRAKQEKVLPKFLVYLFKTNYIKGECYKYGRGIMLMRWRTYPKEFLNIRIALPKISEQKEIIDYIESKSNIILDQIAVKKKIIEKLILSKESLIYEAVTGKIKI